MTIAKIRQALEVRLNAMQPPLPTAWQNKDFSPPVGPFQAPFFLFAEPDDRGYKDSPYIQRGTMTVTLLYPLNEGPGNAQTRAELIRNWFSRGLTVTAGGLNVIIDRTPEVSGGVAEEGRFVIRVRIRFWALIEPVAA